MIKVLGKRLLIKQELFGKKKLLIGTAKDDQDLFDIVQTVEQIGPDCPEGLVEIGDHVVFPTYVQFLSSKTIKRTPEHGIIFSVIHFDDVIAIDNPAPGEDQVIKESPIDLV